jgi:hypothetical protein
MGLRGPVVTEDGLLSLTADFLVVFHLTYVLFVVAGEAAILAGGVLGWGWVRNVPFRIVHLAAIGVVAIEAGVGAECPLTFWEYDLRRLAGQAVRGHVSFVGRIARAIVFHDLPPGFFEVLHIAFGAAVLLTFILIPPRFSRKRGGHGKREGA